MRSHGWAFALALFFMVASPVALPPSALAQDGEQAEDAAESRSTEFRAVTGPDAEEVPGGALLIAAYALIWVFVLIFVLRLGKLHGQTMTEIARLERALTPGDTPERESAD